MEPVESKNEGSKKIGAGTLKKAALITGTVFASCVVVALIFSFYTNSIIGKLLKEVVAYRSEGTYELRYDDINYNFTNRTLYVKNLHFELDSAAIKVPYAADQSENVYGAYVPEMLIDIADIWKVYFNRELDIEGIRAFKPNLNITSYKEEEYNKWQSDAGALYKVISGYLEIFRIDNFKIENGKFLFEKLGSQNKKYEVEDVSFSIKNFLLSRRRQDNNEKFFYTDDIDIALKNQELLLKDSIHKMAFKRLVLSTTESKILVDSLVISEREDLNMHLKQEKHNAFNMYIPVILLDSVNFKEAYNNGLLHIGKLLVHLPEIEIDKQRRKVRDERDSLNNNFSNLVAEYFENVRIDTFSILNASVTFSNLKRQKREQFTLDSTNIILTNLVLDTTIFTRANRKIIYDHVNIEVNDYEFLLPDSIHKVSFKKLNGSSASQLIEVNDVRIEPRDLVNIEALLRKNNRKSVFYGNIPMVAFRGVYGREFINEDSLKVRSLNLHSPDLEIITYQHLEAKKDSLSIGDLLNPYVFISNYFDALYLDELSLENGKVNWTEKAEKSNPILQLDGMNLTLEGIELDSASKRSKSPVASENMRVFVKAALHNFQKNASVLKVDSFQYDSKSGMVKSGMLDYHAFDGTDEKHEAFSIETRGIFARGFRFDHFIEKSGQLIDSLSLSQPVLRLAKTSDTDFQIEKTRQLFGDYYKLNPAQHINISNGTILLFDKKGDQSVNANFTARLSNVHWDSLRHKTLPVVDEYEFIFNKSSLNGKKLNYGIDSAYLGNLGANSMIKGLTINQNLQDNAQTNISVPEINFSNLDLLKLHENKNVRFDECNIIDPIVSILYTKNTASEKNSGINYLKKHMGRYINTIEAEKLSVSNGDVSITPKNNDSLFYAHLPYVDLTLTDIFLDTTKNIDHYDNMLKNLVLSGSDMQLKATQLVDTLFVKDWIIPAASDEIQLNNLFFDKQSQKASTGYSGDMDKLVIRYHGQQEILADNKLHIAGVEMTHPVINLQLKKKDKKVLLKEQLMLSNLNPNNKLFHTLSIDHILCNNGYITLSRVRQDDSERFSINGLNFFGEKFVLDSNRNRPNKLLASENFRCSFKDFSYIMPDSLNRIDIGEIGYSTYDSTLIFRAVTNTPLAKKYDYGPAAGVQSDWLKMKFDSIRFHSLFPMVSLNKNGVIAEKLTIDNMDIYAFRDKRVPREEGLYKPLPQERFMNLKYIIKIDSLRLNNSKVTYEEVTKTAPYSGSVTFTELEADLYNLCNQKDELQHNPNCTIDASGKLMDDGLLEADFTFDLTNPENTFIIDAHLHAMDLARFNELLEPIVRIKVKSGKARSLKMHAEANNELAIGSMDFYYDDLKVNVLNKNNYTTRGMGSTINSFFANTFIINKNNPRLIFTTEGNIFYERDTSRSIFNYWSKIFFSGIVSSIGAKSNKKEIRQYEKSEESNKLSTKEQ